MRFTHNYFAQNALTVLAANGYNTVRMQKRFPNVTVMVNPVLKGNRLLLAGVVDYAREHGPWRFIVNDTPVLGRQPYFGPPYPDGAIISSTQIAAATLLRQLGVPCVLTDSATDEELHQYHIADVPVIRKDNHAIGKLAAEHFLDRRFSNFAFVSDPLMRPWSSERYDGFRRTLNLAGFNCSAYRSSASRARLPWSRERPFLIKFLNALPKPVAVFAANDERARQVMDACIEADIHMPEQASVLGVDNDERICETCCPELSSISTGGKRRGYEAARVLDMLMTGNKDRLPPVLQESATIVERSSTAYGVLNNALLCQAYFYIQDEAPRRDVPVEDVVKVMRCSRRYAELIFRDQLGITIKDEIDRVRLNHVKELLRRTNMTPVEIATQCHFPSDVALYAQFYRKFGLSMRKFRKQIGSLT